MDENIIGCSTREETLAYRKVAMAVVATYVKMPREYVAAILNDEMDEYIDAEEPNRERLRVVDFRYYLELMSKESIIRYAATAAEGLAAAADSDMAQYRIMGDTGLLGLTDDVNAIARVEQILEPVVPDGFTEDEGDILVGAMRGLCDFYNAVAYRLVQVDLLNIILEATERLLVRHTLSPTDIDDFFSLAYGAPLEGFSLNPAQFDIPERK